MSVDLSILEAGDTVHFRCGGSAAIHSIHRQCNEGIELNFSRENEGHDYYFSGKQFAFSDSIFDIIKIEKKPFDWSEVKAGMAFLNSAKTVYIAVGQHPTKSTKFVFVRKDNGENIHWHKYGSFTPVRSPEHDIEVNND